MVIDYSEPCCKLCGAILEWEDCWNNCDEGYFDMYEEDPEWYDYGDVEKCAECHGKGGYWVCPNAAQHEKVSAS